MRLGFLIFKSGLVLASSLRLRAGAFVRSIEFGSLDEFIRLLFCHKNTYVARYTRFG